MKTTVTVDPTTRSATVHLAGDLDFTTSEPFLATVRRVLDDHPDLQRLRLDFTDLSFCDSAGLSALLLVHRRSSAAGVDLRLDHRPPQLDRVLDVTGVLEHLTAPSGSDDAQDETVG